MANELKMDMVHTILALHKLRWSDRRIARELRIDRGTVSRHIRLAAGSNPATNPPTGSEGASEVQPSAEGGFSALLPTAGGDSVCGAVAEGTALLGSNRSAGGPFEG